jgi:carbon monoxide dehydrogenase subunit G
MRVENSRIIARPIEDVFAFLALPENNPLWMSVVTATKRTACGPVSMGETYQHTVSFLGRTFDVTFEVIELEPPRRFCVRNVSGPIEFHGCYTLESIGGQTRFTHTLEGEVGHFFRFGQSLVERTAQRQYAADLATLDDVLESIAVHQS